MKSMQIILKSRPRGAPASSNFELVEDEARSPNDGEVLVKNLFMSVDPYMRGRMREAWKLGDVLEGGAIGCVLESGFDGLAAGDFVSHGLGWREHATPSGQACAKVDANLAPLQSYLGVMGMPGLTA